ncbi:hypothetical protein T4C_8315 [Trichinella pseudospiralis]|uniref:Uncharacterized protein n=1 Tax=Trichinella pseudospiralis TaxID=6337 RepID=A0A0V1JYD4_TRIPS|nr:hypothetical protein T4C_8315 [Trichinella pseudospiralis]
MGEYGGKRRTEKDDKSDDTRYDTNALADGLCAALFVHISFTNWGDHSDWRTRRSSKGHLTSNKAGMVISPNQYQTAIITGAFANEERLRYCSG